MKSLLKFNFAFLLMLSLALLPVTLCARTVTDGLGRQVEIPDKVERVICSGPGCLRLLVYLQARDTAVGVDDIEKKSSIFDARPYALANPRFRELPLIGEFRGNDNPELIATLDPRPQVMFKTFIGAAQDPSELEGKIGMPVVVLNYGDLGARRQDLDQSLLLMGQVLGREQRAREVISFMDSLVADLRQRTADSPEIAQTICYVGGVALKGPHGFQSTEPGYPPFTFVGARNVAAWQGPGKAPGVTTVAKEKILEWNPSVLFVDLSTLQLGDKAGGLHELRTDPAYQALDSVRQGRVYGLLPYNWYNVNFGSVLANAYYVGSVLAPDRFRDIDPAAKADEIYEFLVGARVFAEMDQAFGSLVYQKIPVR